MNYVGLVSKTHLIIYLVYINNFILLKINHLYLGSNIYQVMSGKVGILFIRIWLILLQTSNNGMNFSFEESFFYSY